MKLQRINKYAASVMASLMLFSTTSCSSNQSDEVFIGDTYQEEVVEPVTHSYIIPSEEEVINEVGKYGNLCTDQYMSNMYKVLEFADNNQCYKVMLVSASVDYISLDGKIIGSRYIVFDVFSKEELFCTTNLDTFEDMEPLSEFFKDARILSYSPIDKLGIIAKTMGADDEYVESTLKDYKQISELDAAIMYVSLIPISSRVNLNEFEYSQIKKIG